MFLYRHATFILVLMLTCVLPCAAGGEERTKSVPSTQINRIAMKTLQMLRCELASKPTLTRTENVVIKITVKNEGDKTIRFLKRNTPFETFFADYLRVTRNGKRARYEGPVAKRAVPSADEYAIVAPGASIERSFELFPAYNVAPAGQYQVQWSGEVMDAAIEPDAIKPEDGTRHFVACEPLRFERT
jgi:peptidyl-Lys metalloendopeptidase